MFITFEGIDGSGKSTQMEVLADMLRQKGMQVLVTRDPGGTDLGQQLRKILLHYPNYVSPRCELFLYLADRAQHVDEVIKPALAEGQVVLCDRYIDSTVAYQGGGRGIDVNHIQAMNIIATGGLLPDRTFLFDAPVNVLLQRAMARGEADRFEQENVVFYEKVRQQYLASANAEPKRITIVNAEDSVTAVQLQVLAALPTQLNV